MSLVNGNGSVAVEMLTVETVARRLNVSGDTVRRLIDRKELMAHRFGPRATRIRSDDLDRFIVGHRIPDQVWDLVNGHGT